MTYTRLPRWDQIVKDGFTTIFAVKGRGFSKGKTNIAKPLEILLEETFTSSQKLMTGITGPQYLWIEGEKIPVDLTPASP